MIGSRGTPIVLIFFNRYLTEGLKPKIYKVQRPMSNKKLCRDQCQNWVNIQGRNTYLSLLKTVKHGFFFKDQTWLFCGLNSRLK